MKIFFAKNENKVSFIFGLSLSLLTSVKNKPFSKFKLRWENATSVQTSTLFINKREYAG